MNSAAQTPRGRLHIATSQVRAGNVRGGVVWAQVLRDQEEQSKDHQAVTQTSYIQGNKSFLTTLQFNAVYLAAEKGEDMYDQLADSFREAARR